MCPRTTLECVLLKIWLRRLCNTAKTWASVHSQNTLDTSTFGTYSDFISDFQKAFFSTNSATEATTWLTNTCVCSDNYLPKYMGEFKLKVLEVESDPTTHATTIIHYLCAGIPVWCSDRIFTMETISTTPKAWYEKINQFLSQKHFAIAVAKQHSSCTPTTFHTPTSPRNTPIHDPNAMDVDQQIRPRRLTNEERLKCFKEGWCLRCRQTGHIAVACTKYTNNNSSPPVPPHSSTWPPAKKVAIVKTIASIEEVDEEDEERVIGRLSSGTYNLDFSKGELLQCRNSPL